MSNNIIRGFYPVAFYQDKFVFVSHEASDELTEEIIEINLRDYYPLTFKRDKPVYVQKSVADEICSGITTINIKEYYRNAILPDSDSGDGLIKMYSQVADELLADRRYEKNYERTVRRNQVYSLDADDGISEAAGMACRNSNPEMIFTVMENYCRLCRALNSLDEKPGRRIDAHYLCGKSQTEIAKAEGVTVQSINDSIKHGLRAMRKFFQKDFQNCPDNCP
jgi:RNA polymerase sigma-70 factor (ECF subfamily)